MKNTVNRTINNRRGFTLIEILVVMVIIGLLAGLVGPKFFKHIDSARQKDALVQIAMFEEALDLYRLDNHKYPTTEQGLASLKDYLRKQLPNDPWGHTYQYKNPGDEGREYEIVSYGADGSPGGDGIDTDIVSWKGLSGG
ncbi:MAG: type II secretion system major pseudopilin GspG [Nitrospinota bacterium]